LPGFFGEREAGALELCGELLVARAAGFVPDLAADFVQRVGGGLDDVERVKADDRVRAALGDRPRDPLRVIAGDQLDLLGLLVVWW
jgi:hypothetical protein